MALAQLMTMLDSTIVNGLLLLLTRLQTGSSHVGLFLPVQLLFGLGMGTAFTSAMTAYFSSHTADATTPAAHKLLQAQALVKGHAETSWWATGITDAEGATQRGRYCVQGG